MLSIDEAIAHAKEKAEMYRFRIKNRLMTMLEIGECEREIEEHEQLAELLEDYKQIKMLVPIEQALKAEYSKGYRKAENDYHAQSEKDRQSYYDCGYEVGYNKAIDDFVKLCKGNILCPTFGLSECDIEEIAEYLREGGNNEK